MDEIVRHGNVVEVGLANEKREDEDAALAPAVRSQSKSVKSTFWKTPPSEKIPIKTPKFYWDLFEKIPGPSEASVAQTLGLLQPNTQPLQNHWFPACQGG